MGIACDAYSESTGELADVLDRAVDLADECNLWFNGRLAIEQFAELSRWLRARLAEEAR